MIAALTVIGAPFGEALLLGGLLDLAILLFVWGDSQ